MVELNEEEAEMWEPLKNEAVLTVEHIVFGVTFATEDRSDDELRDKLLLCDGGESKSPITCGVKSGRCSKSGLSSSVGGYELRRCMRRLGNGVWHGLKVAVGLNSNSVIGRDRRRSLKANNRLVEAILKRRRSSAVTL